MYIHLQGSQQSKQKKTKPFHSLDNQLSNDSATGRHRGS